MKFTVYSQGEILASEELTNFLLDTIIHNLSYLFGEDMDSKENRKAWIAYNLETPHPHWRVILGQRDSEKTGFLLYTIENHTLTIHDIEISKAHRFDPVLLRGLFQTLICLESNRFDRFCGYINKGNRVSQSNFLKYTTEITEKENGYFCFADEKATAKIKKKISK